MLYLCLVSCVNNVYPMKIMIHMDLLTIHKLGLANDVLFVCTFGPPMPVNVEWLMDPWCEENVVRLRLTIGKQTWVHSVFINTTVRLTILT